MNYSRHFPVLLIMLFATSIFWFIYGPLVLNPFFTDWMKSGDPAQFFFGFNFFRQEPWSWILGQTKTLHFPYGTSIVYSDSIPLLSILLKLIPSQEPFQFHGIWILVCFLLQGITGYALIYKFTRSRLSASIGAALLLLFPPFLVRNFETNRHYSLLAQFFVLWTIHHLHFHARFRNWMWLLTLSLGVHFYFFAFAFFAFLCVRSWSKKEWGVALTSFLISGFFYGYFVIPPQNSMSIGFSEFSMNLLGWFNSEGFALTRTNIPLVSSYQREGYQYLGAGVIFLGAMWFFKNRRLPRLPTLDRHAYFWVSLTFLALGPLLSFSSFALPDWVTMPLYIAAMTTLIHRIENYPKIKAFLLALLWAALYIVAGKILRASGRAGWFLSYALVLGLMIHLRSRTALAAAILLQLADVTPFLESIRVETQSFINRAPFSHYDPVDIDFFIRGHRAMVLVSASQPSIPFLQEHALRNRLPIGPVYLARTHKQKVREEAETLKQSLKRGQLESDFIYVTDDEELKSILKSKTNIDWMSMDHLLFIRKRKTP